MTRGESETVLDMLLGTGFLFGLIGYLSGRLHEKSVAEEKSRKESK